MSSDSRLSGPVPRTCDLRYASAMNAILKDILKQVESLSIEDQKILAAEIEKRAYDQWLEAEIQKGEASGGEKPLNEVFDRLSAKYGG